MKMIGLESFEALRDRSGAFGRESSPTDVHVVSSAGSWEVPDELLGGSGNITDTEELGWRQRGFVLLEGVSGGCPAASAQTEAGNAARVVGNKKPPFHPWLERHANSKTYQCNELCGSQMGA